LDRSNTASLTLLPNLRNDLERILDAALDAIAPASLLDAAASQGVFESIAGTRVVVVAAGKAAWRMAAVFAMRAPVSVERGLVAGPRVGPEALPDGFEWFPAGHPDPNAASLAAGNRALQMARLTDEERSLVVLLSGGASALLVNPAPGLAVGDKLATAQVLMNAGVAIDGLNCVRKHLSAVKGGRLGAEASRSLTLAISDVHGPVPDDPSVIGSGPTVADPTTYADALELVRKAEAESSRREAVPRAVVAHLERGANGELPETIKPGDPRLARAEFRIIGNRLTAVEGARRAAAQLGYEVAVLPDATHGEAREGAEQFLAQATRLADQASGRFCVLAAGETTVKVKGRGRGGRNQEFALALTPRLARLARPVIVASAGTDGIDGPTDVAGGIVDNVTLERAEGAGLDWQALLADNDAYHFFKPLGDSIEWGPTGTNVGDIHVFLTG
jgi:hydroxypyruvate reductase